ncbi:hypothetical protein NBCG_02321 [Nocardioidaceae bacterium Broad-1]|nr:hypothetical protein NBCG_02321 [Nocardioidaceae bacterium Broad-1]
MGDRLRNGRDRGPGHRLLGRSPRVGVAGPVVVLAVAVVAGIVIAGLVVAVTVLGGVLLVVVVIAVVVVDGTGALLLEPPGEQVETRDRGQPDPEEPDHAREVAAEEERRRRGEEEDPDQQAGDAGVQVDPGRQSRPLRLQEMGLEVGERDDHRDQGGHGVDEYGSEAHGSDSVLDVGRARIGLGRV